MVWCVGRWDDDDRTRLVWCETSSQPSGRPRYRENVKTVCGGYVVAPLGFERREPTCQECLHPHKEKRDA